MTVIAFDKLAYVDRLTSSGIPEKAARAHADSLDIALREQVATKADIERVETALKADIERVETALKADIERVEAALKADIERVEAALKADIERVETALKADIERVETTLRADLAEFKAEVRGTFRLHNWMLTFSIGLSLLIAGKLFLTH